MTTNTLLRLLQKKRSLFLHILTLTQTEVALPWSELSDSLQRKQHILSHIQRIDQQIASMNTLSEYPPEIVHEIHNIQTIIEEILELDQANYILRQQEVLSHESI